MHFNWSTLALQTVNFAVLVWLLHRFLYKPLLRMIDARRGEVEKQFADAAAAEGKVRTQLGEVEAQRAGIAAEHAAMLKAAAVQAADAATARRTQAEREAAELVAAARKSMQAERETLLAEAKGMALDLGAEIARRLLAEVPLKLREEAWLERVEQHLAKMPAADRAQLVDGMAGAALRVVTAVALPDSVEAQWSARLHQALHDGIVVSFESDPALVAGAELYFPHAILRFSWRSVLSEMRAEVEDHGAAR